jgi:membrane protein required for colicin V production
VNIVDGVVVAVLLGGAALGFYWGVVRNLLALLGLVVGVLLSARLGPVVADWLTSITVNDHVADTFGVALVVFAFGALSSLVGSALRLYVGLLCLGKLDHILGALLGFCHAIVTSGIIAAFAGALRYQPWAAYTLGSPLLNGLLGITSPLLQWLGEPLRSAAQSSVWGAPLLYTRLGMC